MPRIVIVGAGFAGYAAARGMSRRVRGAAEVVLLNPTDYFLYLPLLPEVAGGILEPRRVAGSLAATLPPGPLGLGEARHTPVRRPSVRGGETHGTGGGRAPRPPALP